MKTNDLVSVIMPAYNSEHFIGESIESVLRQTYSELELLVIDDHSHDGTCALVEAFRARDPRVRLLRMKTNGGAAESRNMGIDEARGRYIAFCDSDDQWVPRKLERQLGIMSEKGWPFTYTAFDKIDEAGRPLGHMGVPPSVNYTELLKTCVIGCLTVIYDTNVFGKVRMPLILKRQDFALWLKLLKHTPRAYGIHESLAIYRVRGDSVSSNKKSGAHYVWKLYREVEHLSLIASCWNFFNYAFRGVLRHRFPSLARRLGVIHPGPKMGAA